VLVAIADALIEHLRATYRTDIVALTKSFTSRSSATTNAHGLHAGIRRRRATAFRFTDFPSVEIRAGARYSAAFPSCGCDACYETWQDAADDMERLVFAVIDGRFSARITVRLHTRRLPGRR
jgi:hypothetical protein